MSTTDTSAVTSAVQTAGTFATPEIKTFYERELLSVALAEFYHCSFGLPGRIPEGAGGTLEWRIFQALSAATTPLTEAVTPASTAPDIGYVNVTPSWYGSFIQHSDVFKLTAIDPIVKMYSRRLGEQAGLTADTLTRDLMCAEGTAQIADSTGSRGSLTSSNLLDADELLEAWATLKANDAKGFDFLDGRYAVILHPYAFKDLMRDPEFKNTLTQAKPRSDDHPIFRGEVPDWMGMRFFMTSNAKYIADAGDTYTDVYFTLVIAREAIGVGGIGSFWFDMQMGMGGTGNEIMPVDLMVVPAEQPSKSDPLGQRGTIGWKASQEEVELNANWMVRIEHACDMGTNAS